MRGKFVLAANENQLVPFCLSVVQGLSAFQGVRSEGFNCMYNCYRNCFSMR